MKTNRFRFFTRTIAILAIVILCMGIIRPVHASNSGTCGDSATWTLDDNGKLTISGSGAIAADAFAGRRDIKQVIIGE